MPSWNRFSASWIRRLDRFLSPFKDLKGIERQRARLQVVLICLLGLFFLPFSPIWLNATGFAASSILIVGLAFVGILTGYLLSRSRHYKYAAWMLITILVIGVGIAFEAALQAGRPPEAVLKYLILGVLFASLVLSPRVTLAITISFFLLVFFLTISVLHLSAAIVFNELVFNALVSGFIVGSATIRDADIQRLRRSEHRYRSLFEQSNDAVFLLTMQGNHQAVNQRAAELLGYSVDELATLSFYDIVAPEEHRQSERVLERLLANERVPPYERIFRRKDGSLLPVEINVELVRDEAGNPMHIQSIVRDLVGRRRAESERVQLHLELERGRILAMFVRGLSHEFRTPLSVINTNVYLLRRSNVSSSEMSRLQIIQQQTGRINRLVDLMLTMVKLDSDEPIDSETIYLNELVKHSLYDFNDWLARRKIVVSTDLAKGLPRVYGDAQYLVDALKVLIQNAIQYTADPGSISLRTYQERDQVVFEIQDTGMGIAPENLEKIFERFFRADEAHSSEGFGLGLSIARSIAERHHGRIEVKSTLGVGSTFRLLLPAMPDEPPVPQNALSTS